MTKTQARAELMKQIGRGQQMITSAEFRFGFGREISAEQLDAERAEGNRLIAKALDKAEELNIRLPY